MSCPVLIIYRDLDLALLDFPISLNDPQDLECILTKRSCLVALSVVRWRNQNNSLLDITARSRCEDGENERYFSDKLTDESKQIEQLHGTDMLDSFNYNTNLDIRIENKNNEQK